MKNVQFTATEVEMIVNSLASEISTEVRHAKPNYELIGKLTAIKHKITHTPNTEMQRIVDPQHIKNMTAYLDPKDSGSIFPIKDTVY